ncbi:MAG: hypothetical protein J0M02_07475 [Planctomycetes bacterium]|nr:hypothetical protein [Planctomycetota bacterium]
MLITFVSSSERRTWLRLLELDGERCWERAQRRKERAERRRPAPQPGIRR